VERGALLTLARREPGEPTPPEDDQETP